MEAVLVVFLTDEQIFIDTIKYEHIAAKGVRKTVLKQSVVTGFQGWMQ